MGRGGARHFHLGGPLAHTIYSDWIKPFDAWVTKFPFTVILAGIVFALWRYLRNKKWEVCIMTTPLLSNVLHRAMITRESPQALWAPRPWSRYSNFRLQASKFFGSSSNIYKLLAPAPEQFAPKNQKKTLYYSYNSFAQQTISVERNPNFRLRLQLFKLASAAGSCSTALVRSRLTLIHISSSCWTIYRSF